MLTVFFEPHGATLDSENERASGWFDVGLSPAGEQQARELGERYATQKLDAVFCSDLVRSYRTAIIAFPQRQIPIIRDERLRACNYGRLTRRAAMEIDGEKAQRITEPFPNGESYEQVAARVRAFLEEIMSTYDGKQILIIGHRATWYSLERWLKAVSLEKSMTAPWVWQPGWVYKFDQLCELCG